MTHDIWKYAAKRRVFYICMFYTLDSLQDCWKIVSGDHVMKLIERKCGKCVIKAKREESTI